MNVNEAKKMMKLISSRTIEEKAATVSRVTSKVCWHRAEWQGMSTQREESAHTLQYPSLFSTSASTLKESACAQRKSVHTFRVSAAPLERVVSSEGECAPIACRRLFNHHCFSVLQFGTDG